MAFTSPVRLDKSTIAAIRQATPPTYVYPRENYARERYVIFFCRAFKVKQTSEENPAIERTTKATIKLYVPNDFSESISQNWSGESVLKIQSLGEALKTAGVRGAKKALGVLEGTGVAGTLKQKFQRIENPREEVLYQGPNFRSMPMNFEFMPKNRQEVDEVRRIILTFKKYMLPLKAEGGATLLFPPLWNLKIAGGSQFTDMGWKGKSFALTEFNANYTPEGEYVAFKEGFPVKIALSLTFTETQILYQDEITIE
jgi:hypothetical protein